MIYTVTLNPSIDYVVHIDKLVSGITNRTLSEEYYFGGKGINVSHVLAELDLDNTALGFVAGFTGEAIENVDEMVTDATEKLALQATAGEAFDQFLDAVDLAEERGSKHEQ